MQCKVTLREELFGKEGDLKEEMHLRRRKCHRKGKGNGRAMPKQINECNATAVPSNWFPAFSRLEARVIAIANTNASISSFRSSSGSLLHGLLAKKKGNGAKAKANGGESNASF